MASWTFCEIELKCEHSLKGTVQRDGSGGN